VPVTGNPDEKHISTTSESECANLTMRMHSKEFENRAHMVAIWALCYNFIRVHKTLRVTPAMAGTSSSLPGPISLR
jgi:hypothetical protein